MSPNPIGIFDSGSGGLSIWLAVRQELPHESIVYFGDHGHLPYGGKDKSYIQDRVIKAISFLERHGAKLVIIACNTATVAGIDVYRNTFPHLPIVGVVPVVKLAAAESKTKEFLVMSTEYTARSEYQKQLIQSFAGNCTVHNIGCPGIVENIESGEGDSTSMKVLLQTQLEPFMSSHIDTIVLGCTHFAFVKNMLHDIVGNRMRLLDSGGAVGRQTRRILTNNNLLAQSHGVDAFYTSGQVERVQKTMRLLTHESIDVRYEQL